MTNNVNLGIWDRAPFQRSVIRSVEKLNSFLANTEYDTRYEVMRIGHKNLDSLKEMPDIFILDGGQDVNPATYGERNEHSFYSDKRDSIEFDFTRFMSERNVRLSGICRGHQLLNVFFGGSLWQDMAESGCYSKKIVHTSGHKVRLKNISKNLVIGDFVGNGSFSVSSLHHQAVNRLGRGFYTSLAWEVYKRNARTGTTSKGYVIEGIESKNGRVRGLQCHPEFRGYPKDGLLFAYLMHLDSFISDLKDVDDEQLEAKFAHLLLPSPTRDRASPYKVYSPRANHTRESSSGDRNSLGDLVERNRVEEAQHLRRRTLRVDRTSREANLEYREVNEEYPPD